MGFLVFAKEIPEITNCADAAAKPAITARR
jgi:hypothetical protein